MNFKTRRLVLTLLLAWPLQPTWAQITLGGQTFDATARVADSDLVLNGVGARTAAWFKVYVAGLYLPAKAPTPSGVIEGAGPKRLQIRMMFDIPAKEFTKAVNIGIERNTPPEEHAALAERQARFAALVDAVGEVKKGDRVNLDFLPGRGLLFSLNGKPRGEVIPGADLYAAVLKIFLGEKPVDQGLKAGLLGGKAS